MTDKPIEIRPFRLSDIWQIEFEPHDKFMLGDPYLMAGLYMNARMGSAFTASINGKIIACAGISLTFINCGEMWGVFSKEAKKLKRQMLVKTREYINLLVKKFDLKKLTASAFCDWPQGANFLEHLGFKRKSFLFEREF